MLHLAAVDTSPVASTGPVDLGALVLRLVIGVFLAVHGINKVRGGIDGTAQWFAGIGMRWPRWQARLAATVEIGAGLLLAIGLLTPVAAAGVIGVMVVATWAAHRANGFFVFRPGQGWEYTVTIAAVAWAIALIGPQRYSVDHVLGGESGVRWGDWWGGWAQGLVAGVLGVGAGVAQLAVCYRPERT